MFIRDLSHHDLDKGKTVDYSAYDGFIVKATEGVNYIDPTLDTHIAGIRAVGKPFGLYHYVSISSDPVQQANDFKTQLARFPDAKFKPSIDSEKLCADVVPRTKTILDNVPNSILYSGTCFIKENFGTAFTGYELWQADYRGYCEDIPGYNRIGWQYQGEPDLNKFTDDLYITKPVQAPVTTQQPVTPALVQTGDPYTLSVQQKMNRLQIRDDNGNALAEDGILGAHTRQAVTKFESIVGIGQDGAYGPQCEAAYQAIVSKPECKQGGAGTAVRYIQFRVGAGIDGQFGQHTAAAVETWQGANGLTADADVGAHTWAKLIG